MEKSGGPGDDGQTGSVDIEAGHSMVWVADQVAACNVTFAGGSWVIEIRTDSDWGTKGDKCEVSLGGWDMGSGWYGIPTSTPAKLTWDDVQNILIVEQNAGSATLYEGE